MEVFDVSSEGEPEQYLVVELVRGATLRKVLADRGPLPPEVAAALGVELLAALAHAHDAGVVHRDIKPENVMIEHRPAPPPGTSSPARPGERIQVKLTDFGIAKLLDAQGVTSTGPVLGSPAHMAPEQIEGDVDGRADIFGLGVLLYESMVGHLPFEGKNPAQVLRRVLEGIYPSADQEQPKVGKRWSKILDRALARLPEARYDGALAMQAALVSELKLLGVDSPRAELEAWFDDPRAYAERAGADTASAGAPPNESGALIGKLCELGRAARARGDTLEAAAHFNRALAYAPHDAALLKIVATIHRVRASRDLARRLLPLLLVSAALGKSAFYLTRALKPHLGPRASPTIPAPDASSALPSTTASVPVPEPSTPPVARPRSIVAPLPPQRPAKAIERKIVIAETQPQFGLLMAIDGAPIGEAHEGLVVAVDGKAHELRFTCMKGACEPLSKSIPAGEDTPITFPVSLAIKPASLVVDGDPRPSTGSKSSPRSPFARSCRWRYR